MTWSAPPSSFTTDEVLTSTAMSEIVTSVGLAAVGTALVGSPPGAGGYMMQAGATNVTFSSGSASMSFPTAFPNGVLTVIASWGDSLVETNSLNVSTSSTTKSSVGFGGYVSGTAFTGGTKIFWLAIGW